MQENKEICFLCNNRIYHNANLHHVMNGQAYRSKSEEDGLVVYLHSTCHRWLHDHSISLQEMKKKAQKVYEKEIGTRRQFIKRYGKSYL